MDTKYIIDKLVEYGVPLHDAKILGAVAMGESSYNPDIVGDLDLGRSVGLFQIHLPSHGPKLQNWTKTDDRNVWESWLKVPDNNIMAASAVYHSQGLGAWTVYNTGAYKQYMGQNFEVQGMTGPGEEKGLKEVQKSWDEQIKDVFGSVQFGNPFKSAREGLEAGGAVEHEGSKVLFGRLGVYVVIFVVLVVSVVNLFGNPAKVVEKIGK